MKLGGLGSFGRSSMASRRKRGPVTFRSRLSAGLAFSFYLLSVVENWSVCPTISLNGQYPGSDNVRFGSEAVVQRAAAHRQFSRRPNLFVARDLATQLSAAPEICRRIDSRGADYEPGGREFESLRARPIYGTDRLVRE